ncbi:peptidylprolyl isomerase [Pelomonas aquatica]|nr:peptidylprolyl isomerase [Pelomonas aquatica]
MKKKMSLPLRRLGCALAALALMPSGHAAPTDDTDLPETLRRGYVGPIVGPADDGAYARGTLGLIRPSYGRASLYVAWRVMHLPVGAVAKESHERKGSWLEGSAVSQTGADEIDAWLAARGALQQRAPAVRPDYFRPGKLTVAGAGEIDTVEGQCGPDAFAFATRTLRELVADASLKAADRLAWIAGQDAVFARCTWAPGKTAAPPLPALLPASAPARLKALNAYQRAAALFYGDDYVAARQAFDAIAAVPDHPMRPWATLGALRSLVRDAVRDADWDAAVADAWTKRQLRGAEFSAAVAEPAVRHRARADAALTEISARAQAAAADAALAPVQAAIGYTLRRALLQLGPMAPLRLAMEKLDRVEDNPYALGTLDLFQQLYPQVAPDRPLGELAAVLRRHAWFDFIATVQACSDAPKAADAAACDAEHGHALARWQESKDNAWLLAALMTARQPAAKDLPAAEAARAVAAGRPEWASLQFYAARVLRAQGRGVDARAAVEAVAASRVVHRRDRALLEADEPGLARQPAVTEAQVRAEYDRFVALGPTEYRVRHLLVQTRELADAALARIRGGEPFEAVAAAVSADSGSRAKGGDLGWSLPVYFAPPFADAVKRLAPRGLSESPVQTQFGWHVIEVSEVRPRLVPPFEQVKARIQEGLERRAGQGQK